MPKHSFRCSNTCSPEMAVRIGSGQYLELTILGLRIQKEILLLLLSTEITVIASTN